MILLRVPLPTVFMLVVVWMQGCEDFFQCSQGRMEKSGDCYCNGAWLHGDLETTCYGKQRPTTEEAKCCAIRRYASCAYANQCCDYEVNGMVSFTDWIQPMVDKCIADGHQTCDDNFEMHNDCAGKLDGAAGSDVYIR
mmetsp:Transcript_42431/g.76195  ORF Transcript_42431/g.76195 Transcript_42431/m.76195 type:complete len:138 (+) Transcript_42431:54-467(+)